MTTPAEALAVLLQHVKTDRIFVSGVPAPLIGMDRLRAPDYYFVGRYIYDDMGNPIEACKLLTSGGIVSLRYTLMEKTRNVPPWNVREQPPIIGSFGTQLRIVDIVGRNCLRQDAIDDPQRENFLKKPQGPMEAHGLSEGDPITFKSFYKTHPNFGTTLEKEDKSGRHFWIPKWASLVLEEQALSAEILYNLSKSTRAPPRLVLKKGPAPIDKSRQKPPPPFHNTYQKSRPRVGHHALVPEPPSAPPTPGTMSPPSHIPEQQQSPIGAPIYVMARMIMSNNNTRAARYENVLLVKTPDGRRVLEVKRLPDDWATDPRNPNAAPATLPPRPTAIPPRLNTPSYHPGRNPPARPPIAPSDSPLRTNIVPVSLPPPRNPSPLTRPPSAISTTNASLYRYAVPACTPPAPSSPVRTSDPRAAVAPAIAAWQATGPFEHFAPATATFPAGLSYWVCNGLDGMVYLVPLGMRDQWQREMPAGAARTGCLEFGWLVGVPVPVGERRAASVTRSEVEVEGVGREEGRRGDDRGRRVGGLRHERMMSRSESNLRRGL